MNDTPSRGSSLAWTCFRYSEPCTLRRTARVCYFLALSQNDHGTSKSAWTTRGLAICWSFSTSPLRFWSSLRWSRCCSDPRDRARRGTFAQSRAPTGLAHQKRSYRIEFAAASRRWLRWSRCWGGHPGRRGFEIGRSPSGSGLHAWWFGS